MALRGAAEAALGAPAATITLLPCRRPRTLRRHDAQLLPCQLMSRVNAALRLPPQPGQLQRRAGAALQRQRQLAAPQAATPAAASCGPAFYEGWPLWAAFAVCAALGQVVERRTPLGAVLSAPLVSMLVALAAAAAGLIPASSAAADAIWTYLMPLGAAMYLLECDLTQLLGSAGATLAAFLIGAVGTVVGTIVAFKLVGPQLGPEGYKVAAALCASYIGGSVNFAAVSQALALAPGPVLAGAMTADNCIMAVYITTIMSIPAEPSQPAAATGGQAGGSSSGRQAQVTAESLALAVAAAALACTLGNHLAAAAGFGSSGLAVMAVLASGIAAVSSKLAAWSSGSRRQGSQSSSSSSSSSSNSNSGEPAAPAAVAAAVAAAAAAVPLPAPFAGAEALGGALMMLFFATIGAAAGSLQALQGCGWLLLFILLQLSIHLAICLAGGRLLRLPMQAILIASNANVGGPATAAAMASSKGWQHMIQPAMLTGSLGYAVATAIGTAMGHWMRSWYAFG